MTRAHVTSCRITKPRLIAKRTVDDYAPRMNWNETAQVSQVSFECGLWHTSITHKDHTYVVLVSGCNFDTSFVWSKSEASPKVCEAETNTPGISLSYASCGKLVTEFDRLYKHRPNHFKETNPMLVDVDKPVSANFNNTAFPTAHKWDVDKNGRAILNGYRYGFKSALSSTRDLFWCEAFIILLYQLSCLTHYFI